MINLKVSGVIAIVAFLLSFFIGLINRSAAPLLIVRAILFAVLFFVLSGMISFMVSRFLPELLAGGRSEEEPDFFPGSRVNIVEGESADAGQTGASDDSSSPTGGAFMGAQAEHSEEGLGNISDLPDKSPDSQAPAPGEGIQGIGLSGMDQNAQDGYNKGGKLEELPDPGMFTPWDPASFSGSAVSEGFVPEKPPVSRGEVQSSPPASAKSAEADFAGFSDSEDFFPDLDSMAGAFMPTSMGEGSDGAEYSGAASSSRRSQSNKNSGWSGDFNAKDMAAGLRTVLNKEKEG